MLRPLYALLAGLYLQCFIPTYALAENRIVSTDSAVTQILFALQLDTALVGVDVTSNLPQDYRALPVVGYHRALPAEGLLALEPTLVIGSQHLGPPKVLATLATAGVPVLQLPSANDIPQLKRNITDIAVSAGGAMHMGQVLAKLDEQAAQLAASALTGERIAFILAVEPGKLRLAGNGTAGAAFINVLGAQNIADFDAYRTLSAEAILELAPSVILVAGDEDATAQQLLDSNTILKHSEAARSGRIMSVNAASLVAGLSPQAIADAVALTRLLNNGPVQ